MPVPHLTREELLVCLFETFRRYGYDGASMSRIATATGLGKASLYHYFPQGKEQMAAAVIDSARKWFDQYIFQPLESVHPPKSRLVNMLDSLSRHYDQGGKACLVAVFALSDERDLFAEAVRQFFVRWVQGLTQTLTDAGLARDIAQRRAYDGVERIQGALVLARAYGDGKPFAGMCAELPDQLLAGADRATMWTTRQPRFPSAPPPSAVKPAPAPIPHPHVA